MQKSSERLSHFPEYVHSLLGKKIFEVEERTGRRVLNFGLGSPDFPPSKRYTDKLKEYIDAPGAHLYPGFRSIPEFSKGLISWYRKRFGVTFEEKELCPLLGAKEGIAHLSLALLDEGDEALIPDPGYPVYEGSALLSGARPVPYQLHSSFNPIDLEELEKKISRKTKLLWVNFPSNPTGQIISKKDLAAIVDFARRHGIWLAYDNAYSEITFDGVRAPSVLEIPGAFEIAVELGSFSKMFSFAGYRMGWFVGNPFVIEAVAKIKSQIDSGLWLPFQKLAGFALVNQDEEWHKAMVKSYQMRRDIILSYLPRLGLAALPPKGGLYLWAAIPSSYKDSAEFVSDILERKRILFTPGSAFGKNGKRFVRISFCVDIDRIGEYF